jgi:micrococcal nuclease
MSYTKAIALLIAGLLIFAFAQHDETLGADERYFVSKVFDGDTIVVQIGGEERTIRVLGIDTPEVDGPYTKEEPFGKKASARTKSLLENKYVRLIYEGDKQDKYRRDLAHVLLEDGTMLSELLLREGLAERYRRYKGKYKTFFWDLEKEAEKKCIGLWAQRGACR